MVAQLTSGHCAAAAHDQVMRPVVRRCQVLDVAVETGDQHDPALRHYRSLPDATVNHQHEPERPSARDARRPGANRSPTRPERLKPSAKARTVAAAEFVAQLRRLTPAWGELRSVLNDINGALDD
jgi:hypothetical protein